MGSPAPSLRRRRSPWSFATAPDVTARSLLKDCVWFVASGWRKALKKAAKKQTVGRSEERKEDKAKQWENCSCLAEIHRMTG